MNVFLCVVVYYNHYQDGTYGKMQMFPYRIMVCYYTVGVERSGLSHYPTGLRNSIQSE